MSGYVPTPRRTRRSRSRSGHLRRSRRDRTVRALAIARRMDESERVPERGEEHWEGVYATRPSAEVGWFESEPSTSLRLVESVASGTATPVIALCCGAS